MAGATYIVSREDLESGRRDWGEVVGPPAQSVTSREIFDNIFTDTIIIKIDVEGNECKVENSVNIMM